MKLAQVLLDSTAWFVAENLNDCDFTHLVSDSRLDVARAAFVAMPSSNSDTDQYACNAIDGGAVALIGNRDSTAQLARDRRVPFIRLPNKENAFLAQLGLICRQAAGDPSAGIKIVGVTGTNGKTTTAWMIRDALRSLGVRAGYLGTLGLDLGDGREELANTTPFPVELWGLLSRAKDAGIEVLAMEASSHALFQRRLSGVRFDVGVFTNLTQDHLDFHGSMAAYADAKKLLFTEYASSSGKPFVGALNQADAIAAAWLHELPYPGLTFGTEDSDVWLRAGRLTVDSIALSWDGSEFDLPVGGEFNVQNAMAAAAALRALGHSKEETIRGLSRITPVPGRFESVRNPYGIGVIVDYAHTPDALEKVLMSARQLNPRSITAVFGCGGDRDKTKRPKMAAAASAAADRIVVTSDNPRTEDPEDIIRDVLAGIPMGTEYHANPDRPSAVSFAIERAEPGDIVVIAGKGHEDYQIVGKTKHHMDDRELARAALDKRGATV